MTLNHKKTERDVQKIDFELDQGVVSRASDLLLVMALLFSIYGVMSTEIISKFDSSITIWSNTWPRVLFNGIPFAFLAWYLRKKSIHLYFKALLWAIAQPLIFTGACFIHVWPLMNAGHLGIYYYFHAANMFVITFGLTFVAPSRAVMVAHVVSYTLLFLAPLLYITRTDASLTSMIINDYICMTMGACVAGHLTYRLRKKVSIMSATIKSKVTPLVGEAVVSAIYNNTLGSNKNHRPFLKNKSYALVPEEMFLEQFLFAPIDLFPLQLSQTKKKKVWELRIYKGN